MHNKSKFERIHGIIVNNIKLSIYASCEEAFSVAEERLKKAGIRFENAEYTIFKKSVDARRRDDIKFVYSVLVLAAFHQVSELSLAKAGAVTDKRTKPEFNIGSTPLLERPVIVGTGPCGLFAALLLAELGYAPIVLERGGSVSSRIEAVRRFKQFGILDTSTNIQFGAGGAGTFSDGKLITRINDPLSSYVLEKFVEFGATPDILYQAKPHIGTDVLCKITERMIDRINSLGGEVKFNTTFSDFKCSGNTVARVCTSSGEIESGVLVLAIGHSARDTYEMLFSKNLSIEPKDFSVGMRIEHRAEDIDKAMYGSFAGAEELGHAEYTLSHNTKQRGVYTFCMCPGGEVVAAASEAGGLVVNGMSERSRGGVNSNSAVVCSIFKSDYGSTPQGAIEFQRKIEKSAFEAGGSDYSAPIITFGDFADGTLKSSPGIVEPTYRGGKFVKPASPREYLPGFVCDSIKNAIFDFDKKINGFASRDAVLTGAETRTSAPLRILRDNNSRLALGYSNLYPAGEGAGYAGGITSAAIDGLKTAVSIIEKYKPYELG